jgi:hypothetical protein
MRQTQMSEPICFDSASCSAFLAMIPYTSCQEGGLRVPLIAPLLEIAGVVRYSLVEQIESTFL